MKDNDLRRRASRYPLRWTAAVVFDHGQGKPVVRTRTEDLSSVGAAIFSAYGDVTGSIVNLLLAPPGRKRGNDQMVLKARARVVSTVRTPGMAQYRHGLSFMRTPDDGLDILDEILGVEGGATESASRRIAPKIGPLGNPDVQISRALAKAHRYLSELVAKLNVAHPTYPKRYAIVGVPQFDGLAWRFGSTGLHEQQISPKARLCKEVSLNFRLAAEKQIGVTREYPGSDKLKRFLHDSGIEFRVQEKANARGLVERTTFVFPCEVAGSLVLLAQFELGKILLRTSNVCGFGSMEQLLAPEAISDESLAELGAFILAETRQGPLLLRKTAGRPLA